ncbi:hypothetical protein AB0F65_17640 [Nocardia rhamnosiphila]
MPIYAGRWPVTVTRERKTLELPRSAALRNSHAWKRPAPEVVGRAA